jgi:hypothetical protein
MIHYHGVPASSLANCAKFMAGRHGLASFVTAGTYVEVLAEVCQSFVLDNGAFSAWRSGQPITEWSDCYRWYEQWLSHPACDWAIIPDVIDGDESANDKLLLEWPFGLSKGVPVWHYHESIDRLKALADAWPRVALGSSGEFSQVGTQAWWERTDEALCAICDNGGRPRVKLHGLRMLDPEVFSRMPLSSADSCNAGRNCSAVATRCNVPVDVGAEIIIRRVEAHSSSPTWRGGAAVAMEGSLW